MEAVRIVSDVDIPGVLSEEANSSILGKPKASDGTLAEASMKYFTSLELIQV